MKLTRKTLARVPGWSASVLMVVVTVFWTYWGIAEMYHEGWWGAWTNRLPYLVPIAVTLIPGLVAFRWPLVGGALIVVIGLFAAVFFGGGVTVIGLAIALTGGAFVFDGLIRRRAPSQPAPAPMPWWRRHWRYVLLLGAPLIVAVGISAATLPIVLGRVDDGDRSARLIEANGVTLIWAPEGPGWNWLQPWGGYPSWQRIALYGVPPLGLDDKPGYGRRVDGAGEGVYSTAADMAERNLCRYLSADGTTLLDQPQDLWRMPTTDEVVRTFGFPSWEGTNAYEEAIGHCVDPMAVRDKDGISATVLACDLVTAMQHRGHTLLDALDDLARRHGVHTTTAVSRPVEDAHQAAAVLDRLRRTPPDRLAGFDVTVISDATRGVTPEGCAAADKQMREAGARFV